MWEELHRPDWRRMRHAYGSAQLVPTILQEMISANAEEREAGWDSFWGAVNHQGDFYDSTVAAIPFLVEAIATASTPGRAELLKYLNDRWRDAEDYGDPLFDEPPGGVDLETPTLSDEEFAAFDPNANQTADTDDDECAHSSWPRMDLFAWKFGRAIFTFRPVYLKLLADDDAEIVIAASALLMNWPDSRERAKQALAGVIDTEHDAERQTAAVLEFGVFVDEHDVATLSSWTTAEFPPTTRAAAALAWAWAINPTPAPDSLTNLLEHLALREPEAFPKLARRGVWKRGPRGLPENIAILLDYLADSENNELRWRAVQAFAHIEDTHLSLEQTAPVLLHTLQDPYGRIRGAAAFALAQHGEAVLELSGDVAPALITAMAPHEFHAMDGLRRLDQNGAAAVHATRLLAAASHRLTANQRKTALQTLDTAIRHARDTRSEVFFPSDDGNGGSSGMAHYVLSDLRPLIQKPREWTIEDLLTFLGAMMPERRLLSRNATDLALAAIHAREPGDVVAAALKALEHSDDRDRRDQVLGAIRWLSIVAPAAEAAPALLRTATAAEKARDPYLAERARAAAGFIHDALQLPSEMARPLSTGQEIAEALRAPRPEVRALAAEAARTQALSAEERATLTPMLRALLSDDLAADVGVAGTYNYGGRLFHWRRQRRAPRAQAAHALHAFSWAPRDGGLLDAMVAESMCVSARCGETDVPTSFPLALWRQALAAADDARVADQAIRRARRACVDAKVDVCARELTRVLHGLSGRHA